MVGNDTRIMSGDRLKPRLNAELARDAGVLDEAHRREIAAIADGLQETNRARLRDNGRVGRAMMSLAKVVECRGPPGDLVTACHQPARQRAGSQQSRVGIGRNQQRLSHGQQPIRMPGFTEPNIPAISIAAEGTEFSCDAA